MGVHGNGREQERIDEDVLHSKGEVTGEEQLMMEEHDLVFHRSSEEEGGLKVDVGQS